MIEIMVSAVPPMRTTLIVWLAAIAAALTNPCGVSSSAPPPQPEFAVTVAAPRASE